MIKRYLVSVSIIVLIASTYFVLSDKQYVEKRVKNGILVSFKTDKKVYQRDEEFTVTYEIKNVSPVTKRIGFGYVSVFLYGLLRIERDDDVKYFDITKIEHYASDGVIERQTFVLKTGDVVRVSYKYKPRKEVRFPKEYKINYISGLDKSTLDMQLSFPIYIKN